MDKSKKPKWLKQLKRLMQSSDARDRDELQQVIEKLKQKRLSLEEKLASATTEEERTELQEKISLIEKHLKKGNDRLNERNQH